MMSHHLVITSSLCNKKRNINSFGDISKNINDIVIKIEKWAHNNFPYIDIFCKIGNTYSAWIIVSLSPKNLIILTYGELIYHLCGI